LKEADKRRAFLDTSVIIAYLRNDAQARHLFDSDVLQHIQYVINPVVLQELFLNAERAPEAVELMGRLKEDGDLLLSNTTTLNSMAKSINQLRNRVAHSNDLMILEAASDCDFLVTSDRDLLSIKTSFSFEALSPGDFLKRIGHGR
jgi:predicted nucleic acid-binding protein